MFSFCSGCLRAATFGHFNLQVTDLVDDKAQVDCMKEMALLQRLDHPNIIKYYASFLEDGALHIVLELADGGDLAKVIKASLLCVVWPRLFNVILLTERTGFLPFLVTVLNIPLRKLSAAECCNFYKTSNIGWEIVSESLISEHYLK